MEPPVVLRVHRPWVRRGRVAGLRRLRERLQGTQVRVARPIRMSGCDLLRVADRWAEIEEFVDHVQPRADEDSYVRLFEELGRLHSALKAVWEPSPPEPLDDHKRSANCVTRSASRRRLGPRSEPVVHRMRQLTGELSKLRKEVELPCTPIHGDYKLGNAGELSDGSWATFDLDFARVRERLYDIAASLHHVAQRGDCSSQTARRLRRHGSGTADSRRAPLAPRGSRTRGVCSQTHRAAPVEGHRGDEMSDLVHSCHRVPRRTARSVRNVDQRSATRRSATTPTVARIDQRDSPPRATSRRSSAGRAKTASRSATDPSVRTLSGRA